MAKLLLFCLFCSVICITSFENLDIQDENKGTYSEKPVSPASRVDDPYGGSKQPSSPKPRPKPPLPKHPQHSGGASKRPQHQPKPSSNPKPKPKPKTTKPAPAPVIATRGFGGADPTRVTVSGISSGAFMAVQLHVAFSSQISGAGIVAGGPYYSAGGNLATALAITANPSTLNVGALTQATQLAASLKSIDNPTFLNHSRVWILCGLLDTVVPQGVSRALVSYYSTYITDSSQITANFALNAAHAMITDHFGNACSTLGSPFINNCNYDAAGNLLAFIMDQTLQPRTVSDPSRIVTLDQTSFMPSSCPFSASQVGLADKAYAYIPQNCQLGHGCALHVAFHGCLQTTADIGQTFILQAGYNEWAESNNIIVLYPQAVANTLNPKGCWDWWGYSGVNYATQSGYQIATIKNMMDSFTTN